MSTTNPTLRLLIYIMVSSGGVGKTFIAQLLEAIAALQNISTHLASQDPSSQALASIFDDVEIIPPNPDGNDAKALVNGNLSKEMIILDVGANPETEVHSPVRFAYELDREMRAIGGRFIAVCPTGSLKPKGLKTAIRTVEALSAAQMDAHLVLNQTNQSKAFGALPSDFDAPVSTIPYMQSGIQEYRMDHRGSIANLITSPPPGFGLAGHHLSKLLIDSSKTLLFDEIFKFGPNGLKINGFNAPPHSIRPISTKIHATDEMLQLAYELSREHEAMKDRVRSDVDRLASLNSYCDLTHAEAVIHQRLRRK